MDRFDYNLTGAQNGERKRSPREVFEKLTPLVGRERGRVIIAFASVIANAFFNLVGPLIVGYVIDAFISKGDYPAVLWYSGLLLAIYILAFVTNYVQMRVMGGVAQRTLWRLRGQIFGKIQELPLAFFHANKAGDLISRINSDTDRLNTFFSQGLMRFVGNIFLIVGAGAFIIFIDWKLALAALAPGAVIYIFTRVVRAWVKRTNAESLRAAGLMSAEVQESISNFKVVLAFNRRDYFKSRFGEANERAFKTAFWAGVSNELFTPVFEFMGNLAQLIVLGAGIYLIALGQFQVGLLVSFLIYVTRFYDPLREMARLSATFQTALAAWDRISRILRLESNLRIMPEEGQGEGATGKGLLEFRDVSFGYPDGGRVLDRVSFVFERGKTYAFVGPTGGGKTTTASLVARLYDPTEGRVFLDGKDIRSYPFAEKTRRIGFILQDAYLMTGTIRDNITYGNPELADKSDEEVAAALKASGLDGLMSRFDQGLATPVSQSSSLSLGERQIVAFVRAVLRRPEVLILDEATANIDTVTEQVLEDILAKLPKETTKVVIAHRLNTIASADDIFFVNGGEVREAGSMEHAVEMLLHNKRKS